MNAFTPIPLGLRAAARSLLLPIASGYEEDYVDFILRTLGALGIRPDEQPGWLEYQLENWRTRGEPGADFLTFIESCLHETQREPINFMFESEESSTGISYIEVSQKFSKRYFAIHKTLVKKHVFSHDSARQLLSHAGLIARLNIEERMSASEIGRVLSSKDSRAAFNWPAIKAIIAPLGLWNGINRNYISELFERDAATEPVLFGDLDLEECCEKIEHLAKSLGSNGGFDTNLKNLLDKTPHPPYLVILHYMLSMLGTWDHAVSFAYEFQPRGQGLMAVRDKYRESGFHTGDSPILNNAKATLRIDSSWAITRDDNRREARALASTLSQLEDLSYPAKKEIASQIRVLLNRVLRIAKEHLDEHGIPNLLENFDGDSLKTFISGMSQGNTQTQGVLEQRVVDCLSTICHSSDDGWDARGVSDSVFAANLFRKKLGDCEFIRASQAHAEIVAYEAHGGRLTAWYLDSHMSSLQQVLAARKDELEMHRPLQEWEFSIIYLCHEVAEDLPHEQTFEIDGANIKVEARLFEDEVDLIELGQDEIDVFNELLVSKLNNTEVHQSVRERFQELL